MTCAVALLLGFRRPQRLCLTATLPLPYRNSRSAVRSVADTSVSVLELVLLLWLAAERLMMIDWFIGFGSQRLDYNVYIQTYIQQKS